MPMVLRCVMVRMGSTDMITKIGKIVTDKEDSLHPAVPVGIGTALGGALGHVGDSIIHSMNKSGPQNNDFYELVGKNGPVLKKPIYGKLLGAGIGGLYMAKKFILDNKEK